MSKRGRQKFMEIGPFRLTLRQIEVARLAASGMTNKEIAVQIGILETGVKWHLTNIYRITGVKTRSEFIYMWAYENNFQKMER